MMELARKVAASLPAAETERSSAMDIRNYALVTAAYWGFTLTDGALRMLVLLHFHELGYTPVNLAFLFLLYEFFGIVTNLFGGWIGSRLGLRVTLFGGLATQVVALLMLSAVSAAWAGWLSVGLRHGRAGPLGHRQGPHQDELEERRQARRARGQPVAPLQLGGAPHRLEERPQGRRLLPRRRAARALWASAWPLWAMAGALAVVLAFSVLSLRQDLGKSQGEGEVQAALLEDAARSTCSRLRGSSSSASRDVWFVVGLPIFLYDALGWSFSAVGAFLAAWVIGYGMVQAAAPRFVRGGAGADRRRPRRPALGLRPGRASRRRGSPSRQLDWHPTVAGPRRAWHSSASSSPSNSVGALLPDPRLHRLATRSPSTSASTTWPTPCGRLLGTLLSGVMYLIGGLPACLWTATLLVLAATLLTLRLPTADPSPTSSLTS